jgi:hypothetical protein
MSMGIEELEWIMRRNSGSLCIQMISRSLVKCSQHFAYGYHGAMGLQGLIHTTETPSRPSVDVRLMAGSLSPWR